MQACLFCRVVSRVGLEWFAVDPWEALLTDLRALGAILRRDVQALRRGYHCGRHPSKLESVNGSSSFLRNAQLRL